MISKKNSNNDATDIKKVAIIITAAGSSTRIGGKIKKEYLPFKDNSTVLSYCGRTFFDTFLLNKNPPYQISDFIITYPKGGYEECRETLAEDLKLCNFEITLVEGGNTRQKSVYNGLKAITKKTDYVLIHDGARPFVTSELIVKTLEAAVEYGASVPGITPTDTQKEIDDKGFITRHLQRNMLTAVQTPQCFELKKLLQAHKKATTEEKEYTDDTEIWGTYCGNVKVVQGDVNNIKITYPSDLEKLKCTE